MIQREEWPLEPNAEVWTVPIGYAITRDIVRRYGADVITFEHLATTLECEVYKLTVDARMDAATSRLDFLCNAIEQVFICTQNAEQAKAVARTHKSIIQPAVDAHQQRASNGFGFSRN